MRRFHLLSQLGAVRGEGCELTNGMVAVAFRDVPLTEVHPNMRSVLNRWDSLNKLSLGPPILRVQWLDEPQVSEIPHTTRTVVLDSAACNENIQERSIGGQPPRNPYRAPGEPEAASPHSIIHLRIDSLSKVQDAMTERLAEIESVASNISVGMKELGARVVQATEAFNKRARRKR